jgi:TetR/AcrR family transcriptional regulator, lmrAB and yxaGH operons repressor
MSEGSRERMVRSAARLIRARGLNATAFSDVLQDSGAPRGSIYHHFPEGKTQLAEEAIRLTSAGVLDRLASSNAASPAEVMKEFIGFWRYVVVASNARAGCVVAGVAVDTDVARQSGQLELVRTTFASWVHALAERLAATGLSPRRAKQVATAALAAMEGALILCRAEGGVEPLDVVGEQLMLLVR